MNRYGKGVFRVISYNTYGTECIHEGSYEQCLDFCKEKNWTFIDRNKNNTKLEIF